MRMDFSTRHFIWKAKPSEDEIDHLQVIFFFAVKCKNGTTFDAFSMGLIGDSAFHDLITENILKILGPSSLSYLQVHSQSKKLCQYKWHC